MKRDPYRHRPVRLIFYALLGTGLIVNAVWELRTGQEMDGLYRVTQVNPPLSWPMVWAELPAQIGLLMIGLLVFIGVVELAYRWWYGVKARGKW